MKRRNAVYVPDDDDPVRESTMAMGVNFGAVFGCTFAYYERCCADCGSHHEQFVCGLGSYFFKQSDIIVIDRV